MIKINKKYKNIPELFGGCKDLAELEKIKTEYYNGTTFVDEDYSFYHEDILTHYKCFCGKGEILEYYNYEEGMGSDIWIYCDCKDCIKKLKEKARSNQYAK